MSGFDAGRLIRVPCPLGMDAFQAIKIGTLGIGADGETVYRKAASGWVESSKTPVDVLELVNQPGMELVTIRVVVR